MSAAKVEAVLDEATAIGSALGTCLLDCKAGMCLGAVGGQCHLVRLVKGADPLFTHLALNRSNSNLVMARPPLTATGKKLA